MTIIVRAVSKKEFSIRLEGRYENKAEIYTVVFRRKKKSGYKCEASCITVRNVSESDTNKDANGKVVKIPQGILREMRKRAEEMFRFNTSSHFMNNHELVSPQLSFRL